MSELGKNKVGPLRQLLSRVAYELHLRNTYYQPQANAKIVGPSQQALVLDDFALVARVQLRGKETTAVLHGDLPQRAHEGKSFRVSVMGPMDRSVVFYEQQTGMRPEIRLQVVQPPVREGFWKGAVQAPQMYGR